METRAALRGRPGHGHPQQQHGVMIPYQAPDAGSTVETLQAQLREHAGELRLRQLQLHCRSDRSLYYEQHGVEQVAMFGHAHSLFDSLFDAELSESACRRHAHALQLQQTVLSTPMQSLGGHGYQPQRVSPYTIQPPVFPVCSADRNPLLYAKPAPALSGEGSWAEWMTQSCREGMCVWCAIEMTCDECEAQITHLHQQLDLALEEKHQPEQPAAAPHAAVAEWNGSTRTKWHGRDGWGLDWKGHPKTASASKGTRQKLSAAAARVATPSPFALKGSQRNTRRYHWES